jgi:hypothetical protein
MYVRGEIVFLQLFPNALLYMKATLVRQDEFLYLLFELHSP